jgi:hypothetical protein
MEKLTKPTIANNYYQNKQTLASVEFVPQLAIDSPLFFLAAMLSMLTKAQGSL